MKWKLPRRIDPHVVLLACVAVVFVVVLFVPFQSAHAEQLVFVGTPDVKMTMTYVDLNTHEKLSAQDAQSSRVAIVEREGRYFWSSRQNREMVRSRSGAFTVYTCVDGCGYVRVMDGGSGLYVEVLPFGVLAYVYYGHGN